jgi:hypothetical protein
MDATFAALRDAFISVLEAGTCSLCGRALVDEAVWLADAVFCLDCGRVHGDPSAPRVSVVWRPAAAGLLLATDAPDARGGP